MNPIGAMGKVTQLTYGAIAPGNIQTNLMTAGVTAGAVCSCSDTVGNPTSTVIVIPDRLMPYRSYTFTEMVGLVLVI